MLRIRCRVECTMTYTPTILCQRNGGCFGCCGHDFAAKKRLKEAIRENTAEFSVVDVNSEKSFVAFRERTHPNDLRHGVCRNLIEEKGCFLCPLHPTRHSGRDLRIGHCDTNYLCPTAQKFEGWDQEKQETFLKFIDSLGIDNVDYSLKMDSGELLREFENYGKGK